MVVRMKVFVYGDALFSNDMVWGFTELGCEVRRIGPGSVAELDELLSLHQPDLLLTLGSPAFFNQLLLKHLGERSDKLLKCCHWDTDGITWEDIETRHIDLMKPDVVFTVCPDMRRLLTSRDIPCQLLFYAFNPLVHRPGPSVQAYEDQLAFVGGAYPAVIQRHPEHYRRRSMDVLFKPLLEHGYRLDFYGDNNHKQVIRSLYRIEIPDAWLHGRYPYEKTCEIYRSCAFNLVTQNHEHTLTKRLFEILGSGGFALSYDNAAVRQFFRPGVDLAVSASPEQTLSLIAYYQANQDEYLKIRENAADSAMAHTYRQRAETILLTLF
jgi:spore maturation protein CgeB